MLNGFTVDLYLVHHLPIPAISNGRQVGLCESMIQSLAEIRTAMVVRLRLVCLKSRTFIFVVHLGVLQCRSRSSKRKKKVDGSTFIVMSHGPLQSGKYLPFFSTPKKCSLNWGNLYSKKLNSFQKKRSLNQMYVKLNVR